MNLANYKSTGMPSYVLATDEIAGGASKLMLDLFNAIGSNKTVLIAGIYAMPKTDVAVTGVVSARFDIFKTSAIGTGGATATYNGTANNAINIMPMDSANGALPSQITARSGPGGGATISGWFFPTYQFPEETNAAGSIAQTYNLLKELPEMQPLALREGEGILIKQGTVASVNNFVFIIGFGLVPSQ